MKFKIKNKLRHRLEVYIAEPRMSTWVAIKFRVRGNIRFLSHLEMLKVFERAFVRAGTAVVYSEGFNPHMRMSLPLPRSVGTESDDELLYIKIKCSESEFDSDDFTERLSEQLPDGVDLICAQQQTNKRSFKACSVDYYLPFAGKEMREKVRAAAEQLKRADELFVQRQTDEKGTRKTVDVRGFLGDIELQDDGVRVRCNVNSSGTIRIEEIMGLLAIGKEDLSGAIRRMNVKWFDENR